MSKKYQPVAVDSRVGHRVQLEPGVNPLVREFFRHMKDRRIRCKDLAELSGINGCTLANWRKRKMPNVSNLEAALNAMGLRLAIVPMEEK